MIENKLMKTYTRPDIIFEKGEGSYLFDTENNKYLDFVAGVAVNSLGHCSKIVVNAIEEQSKKLMHISNLYWSEPQLELAEFLISESDHDEVFFVNSGTESIETAIKISRKYGKQISESKSEILFLVNSFHGRTVGALSITGQSKYQVDFMPLMGNVNTIIANDIDDLKNKISEKTCAVFVEPIQGEGGIIPLDDEFLLEIRKQCNNHDALLVFDEVQCGIGRTGTFYAYQNTPVIPDVMCIAKGLGGGFPIGVVVVNKKSNVLKPGDHGCTFGGNPLACATSLAVVKEINKKEFLDEVKTKGEYIKSKIEEELAGCSSFKSCEGKGLMIGIHLNTDAKPIIDEALSKKMLIIGAGKNVIRIVPALNIPQEDVEKGIEIVSNIIKSIG